MKAKIRMVIAVVFTLFMVSCGVDYKKTKSGLVYKIIPGGSKDSAATDRNVIKFNFIRKLNDSLIYSTYGKLPAYQVWTNDPQISYSPLEVLFMMKKGDSATIVESVDTLIKKGMQAQIPFAKKGDQIKTYIKVLEIFRNDSLVEADYKAEVEKDKPRQDQEMKDLQAKELEDLKKSGELEKEEKEIQAYLQAKNISAIKAPGGTYVLVKEKGTGAPAANGKFITVKYAGKILSTDSLFQASQYIFELGQGDAIKGWHDGIPMFTERRVRIKILNEKGIDRANIIIPFYHKDDFEYINKVQAYTFNYDASGIQSISEVEKKSIYTEKQNSYYSLVKFAMPAVKVGSIIEYHYVSTMKHYGGLEEWKFQTDLPTLKSSFLLQIIPGREFAYTVQKNNTIGISSGLVAH